MKHWVQIAVVSILLIVTVNIGVLNIQTMDQRREMSRIAGVSQICDQMLYERVKAVHQKVTEHENNVRWVVDTRMRSVVTLRFQYMYRIHPIFGEMGVNPNTQEPWCTWGAGVVIDESGTVLTAAHLLDSGEDQQWGPITRAWITFEDGTERDITGIACAPECKPDVGVAKFDPNGLEITVVPMVPEMRKLLHKGDQVVVFGAPCGYSHSVEVGTLATPYRQTTTPLGDSQSLIQLSAHIMGGNSGGPVFDMDANLLGIVTYIHGHEGAAFVVPVDLVIEGMEKFVEVPL